VVEEPKKELPTKKVVEIVEDEWNIVQSTNKSKKV
jgi:hypothetical protein